MFLHFKKNEDARSTGERMVDDGDDRTKEERNGRGERMRRETRRLESRLEKGLATSFPVKTIRTGHTEKYSFC